MPLARRTRTLLQRVGAAVLVAIVVPALLAVAALSESAPVRSDEPAPRDVIADEQVQLVDDAATERARRTAAESVEPVLVVDEQAQAAMVDAVRQLFTAVKEARQPVQPSPSSDQTPGADGGVTPSQPSSPSEDQQLQQLSERVDVVDEEGLRALIRLSDADLRRVETETIEIAQELARLRIQEDELDGVVSEQLSVELNVRPIPENVATLVVEPLLREVARPTVVVDPDATQSARQRAADQVDEVVRSWQPGDVIVSEGEIVDEVQLEAVRIVGEEGADPLVAVLKALGAMAVVIVVGLIFLHALRPPVWRSGRKLLLLSFLIVTYALLAIGVDLLTGVTNEAWWYAVPAGALAMLATMLVGPIVGIVTLLPAAVLPVLLATRSPHVGVYAAVVVLLTVPQVHGLTSRADLRRATLRVVALYPLAAFATEAVFGPGEHYITTVGAGFASGIVTAMLVQAALPFLESIFRLPTLTALLDLADRNHPLLRELEQKAPGSYQHSTMVASLVERACREIGANPLLGTVGALYHDIGKVRQPHFFIENQQGIRNPHDELEPRVSATIIQRHVTDGVEMAREYRLPPEVVAMIGSHHGTMVVTYFYRKALDEVGGDPDRVDVDHYRYKGHRPRSKEAAVLMVSDCCEATTRAMAMERGTIPRNDIEVTVDTLLEQRLDDGQFLECDLTFDELRRVRDSVVEALVGVYHPRIMYPGQQSGNGPPPEQRPGSAAQAADPVKSS